MKRNIKIFAYSILLIFATNIFNTFNLYANLDEDYLNKIKNNEVIIRLTNGDILKCQILDLGFEKGQLTSISVQTKIGKTKIYLSEIIEILPWSSYNRNSHRIFLLPTAEPIENNHFIGNVELLMLYGGFGISKYFSFTAGQSIVPAIRSDQQITLLNAKATVYQEYWDSMYGHISLALGGNMVMVNSYNKISHIYGAVSFTTEKSIFTASLYSKIGDKDFYEVNLGNNLYTFPFENGSFGIALGIDSRFSTTNDTHFIGELWNSDITKPSNSGILLGFRIGNSNVSADFGLAIFTTPYFIPFTSFVWTPF